MPSCSGIIEAWRGPGLRHKAAPKPEKAEREPVGWLLDTRVVSELRNGVRGDPGVVRWAAGRLGEAWLSVLTVGEIRRGIELTRRKDEVPARHLDVWLAGLLGAFESRILPVDARVTEVWGRLNVPDPLPTVDALLAATALVHDLTLVTRNVEDIAGRVLVC